MYFLLLISIRILFKKIITMVKNKKFVKQKQNMNAAFEAKFFQSEKSVQFKKRRKLC
jgi:hypothetical protein